MKKRMLSLCLAVLMLTLVFTGCGETASSSDSFEEVSDVVSSSDNFVNKYATDGPLKLASEGTYTVDGDKVTIIEAIAKAGDVTKAARLDRIAVIRMVDGKQQIFYNDLRTADIFMSPTYYLQQNDIVYVEPKYSGRSAEDKWWQVSSFVVSVISLASSVIWALSGSGIIGK